MQKSLCEYLVLFSNGSGKIDGLTYKKVTFRYNDKDDQLKINIHTILKRLKKFKSGVLKKNSKIFYSDKRLHSEGYTTVFF